MFNIGISGFIGKHHTEETKQKIRLKLLGKNNGMWNCHGHISYTALHQWVRRNLPKPELCPMCKKVAPYEVHNSNGNYNRELHNWIWLCRSCHMIRDGRLEYIHSVRPVLQHDKNGRFMKMVKDG